MCGIVGCVTHTYANQILYDALTAIQHRGQDAAGIMTCEGDQLFLRKGTGLVRDVIRQEHMLHLPGTMGIGHVRYPTAGFFGKEEAQPFYVNSPYGLSLVHNGNLINAEALKKDLLRKDLRHLNTSSDSEVLLNVFAHELGRLGKADLLPKMLFRAVKATHQRCEGAYAAIVLVAGQGILGFRDPYGIRPLCFGQRETKKGVEYMMASESVALDTLGYERIGDVAPGEAVFIDLAGEVHRKQCVKIKQYSPCIFEHVYLARPDSLIDDILVYKVRLRLGECLAERIMQAHPDHDIDVVMPIPDTSRTFASPLARCLGVKYREAFVKNRYIGRTFIMPGQTMRRKSVRRKLNPIRLEFKNKNVLLVDDSIVRGTTSKAIIQMARDAGAKKVYFASAAPPVRYPNVYGIDMPTANELIAHNRTPDEIKSAIGADWLIYNHLESLVMAAREGNPGITRFEDSIFTGDYVTNNVTPAYLAALEKQRGNPSASTP